MFLYVLAAIEWVEDWLSRCAVGVLRKCVNISSVNRRLNNRGIGFSSMYLSDKSILWCFDFGVERDRFLRNSFIWEDYFISMSMWSDSLFSNVKLAWIKVLGAPLSCWDQTFFMNIGGLIGEPLLAEEDTVFRRRVDRGKVLVLIPKDGPSSWKVNVKIGNVSFMVKMIEDNMCVDVLWMERFLGLQKEMKMEQGKIVCHEDKLAGFCCHEAVAGGDLCQEVNSGSLSQDVKSDGNAEGKEVKDCVVVEPSCGAGDVPLLDQVQSFLKMVEVGVNDTGHALLEGCSDKVVERGLNDTGQAWLVEEQGVKLYQKDGFDWSSDKVVEMGVNDTCQVLLEDKQGVKLYQKGSNPSKSNVDKLDVNIRALGREVMESGHFKESYLNQKKASGDRGASIKESGVGSTVRLRTSSLNVNADVGSCASKVGFVDTCEGKDRGSIVIDGATSVGCLERMDRIFPVASPSIPKRSRGRKNLYPMRSHSMKTRSVSGCDSIQQRKPEVKTNVVWNLHDEIAKVIERGLARGLDFNGKKKVILEIIAMRVEKNDNRFHELVKILVSKYKPMES